MAPALPVCPEKLLKVDPNPLEFGRDDGTHRIALPTAHDAGYLVRESSLRTGAPTRRKTRRTHSMRANRPKGPLPLTLEQALLAGDFLSDQLFDVADFLHELLDVVVFAVDAHEADVGHLVQAAELLTDV